MLLSAFDRLYSSGKASSYADLILVDVDDEKNGRMKEKIRARRVSRVIKVERVITECTTRSLLRALAVIITVVRASCFLHFFSLPG